MLCGCKASLQLFHWVLFDLVKGRPPQVLPQEGWDGKASRLDVVCNGNISQ